MSFWLHTYLLPAKLYAPLSQNSAEKIVYFSPINQIPYGTLFIAFQRISINCHIKFILAGVQFHQLLEIDALKRLGMNIFQYNVLEICI
jgi:hypothetical protein